MLIEQYLSFSWKRYKISYYGMPVELTWSQSEGAISNDLELQIT